MEGIPLGIQLAVVDFATKLARKRKLVRQSLSQQELEISILLATKGLLFTEGEYVVPSDDLHAILEIPG